MLLTEQEKSPRTRFCSRLQPPKHSMDKLRDILQLCFPRLTPEDMCRLQRTCRELRDMRVSWRGHIINFHLNESVSAV